MWTIFRVSLAIAIIVLGISSNGAEATSFNLTTANQPFVGGPPYGTVDVTANSGAGTITFVVTALDGSTNQLGEFGFNTDLTLLASNFDTVPPNWTLGSGQMDGFGPFVWTVGSSANADRVHQATIVIDGLTAAEATEAHFEITNASPYNQMFAAHLFQTDGLTGFIGGATTGTGGPPPQVPEPTTMLLLGLGLIGLAGVRRKFEK